ncbi:MAG: BatA and WFA domain-containing protein, partial [Calditrichia bacterium]|nr:BatA and WFA domain-containing protein [Calditrichia bacterium]
MLEFLNPLYLFGLSAAIIPLLIHFFNKRKAKIEKISSIQFLKRIENKNIRNLKLKEYLLLLLRILIILLIVLSFSEPVVKTSGNYSVLSQNNCYFILIDNSYSMKYIMENGLQAKQRVKNEIEILVNKFRNKGSMFLLFSKNDEIKIYPVMKDEKWKERLHEIKWNNSNFLINGLDKALNSIIEEKKTINNYLFVFSDFQKLNNYDWLNSLPTSMSTYFIPFTVTSRKNVGIQGLKIKSKILSPNHKMILELYLKNYSEKIDMETRFFLKINEKVVLQKNVLIPHGDEQFVPVEFLMQMENRGWNTGEIILNSDEIEEDNRYFFSFYVPHDYNILISSGNNNAFWKRVFKPLVAQSGVNVKFINEKELMSVSFNKYDMLLLNTGFNFSGNEVMKIKQFMEEGNRLLLIPEFPVSQTGLEDFFTKFNLGK